MLQPKSHMIFPELSNVNCAPAAAYVSLIPQSTQGHLSSIMSISNNAPEPQQPSTQTTNFEGKLHITWILLWEKELAFVLSAHREPWSQGQQWPVTIELKAQAEGQWLEVCENESNDQLFIWVLSSWNFMGLMFAKWILMVTAY